MKNKQHIKLKAFTLVELAITMIITGIVIAFTIASFQIITKLHLRYQEKIETINQFEKLRYLLAKDNFESKKIIKENNGFSFFKDSSIIHYLISKDNLIRIQSVRKDTFTLKDLMLESFYKEQLVLPEEKIDLLKLNFEEEKSIIINKEYAAKELMTSKWQ